MTDPNADAAVMASLNELDPRIEPQDKAATKRFCQRTKKPTWYPPSPS